jgi:hypothetical protein
MSQYIYSYAATTQLSAIDIEGLWITYLHYPVSIPTFPAAQKQPQSNTTVLTVDKPSTESAFLQVSCFSIHFSNLYIWPMMTQYYYGDDDFFLSLLSSNIRMDMNYWTLPMKCRAVIAQSV